jgi:hypothetical protein
LELGLNGIFLGLNGIDFLGFLGLKSQYGTKKCRANWNTDDTDFTDLHGFFLNLS